MTIKAGNASVKVYRMAHATAKTGWTFVLIYRDGGIRKRQKFASSEAAIAEGRLVARKLNSGNIEGASIGKGERDEYHAARRIALSRNVPLLAAVQEWDRARQLSGDSLIPACESWSARKGEPRKRLKVTDVVNRFLQAKTKVGVQVVKNHGHIFEDIKTEFGEFYLDTVTTPQLTTWLEKREHPSTRNTFRKHAVALWRWAQRQGFLSKEIKTEAEQVDSAKESDLEIGIISAATFRGLLENIRSEHQTYIAPIVLAGFCGLRRREIHSQKWSDIELGRRFLKVAYPASDPYVTAVGGTNFNTDVTQSLTTNSNTALSTSDYMIEDVFTDYTSSSTAFASGGGVSQYFAKPTWQVGNGTLLGTETYRCVPDISGPWGFMVNHSSFSDLYTNATWEAQFAIIFTNVNSANGASQLMVLPESGTSLASPVIAGVVALINQNRGSNGSIGYLNPWLYQIGENYSIAGNLWAAFNDMAYNTVNLWTLSIPAVGGATPPYAVYNNWDGFYNAGPGYDLCTGIGTPNVSNLAALLKAGIYAVTPQGQTVSVGASVVFSAFAEISPYEIAPATYQWKRNGSAISGATSPQLLVSSSGTQLANNGDQYSCVVTLSNTSTVITTPAATLTVQNTTSIGYLKDLSTRAYVTGTGSEILDGGYVVSGTGSEPVLLRATGPTLASFGVSGVLPDPTLTVLSGSTQIGYDYIWGGSTVLSNAFSAVGAFSWPTNSDDSAVLFASGLGSPALSSLAAGAYTAEISGKSGDSGVALLEIYDANPALGRTWTSGMPFLSNISTRAFVGTGGNIMVGGFVLGGSTSRTLLIRASGPALAAFGVTPYLPDPQLTIFNSSGTAFAANEVWDGNPLIAAEASSVGAFSWSTTSNDSAVVVTLPPGSYSAQIEGATGDTGIALLEIYLLP